MLSSVDEKLQLLALDTEAFADGMANIMKFYMENKKDDDSEEGFSSGSSSSTILNNYLALEDNSPIMTP
jgi:hypothetical protein